MKEHEITVENTPEGTARGQQPESKSSPKRRLSKTHSDYWFSRLRKRSYQDRKTGSLMQVPDWQVRLKKDRRESWFNLGTANQAAAARQAKTIYTFLEANGWEATLLKFKSDEEAKPTTKLTVGEFLKGVSQSGKLRPKTFLNYQNCLRTIVSGIFGIQQGASKFDYRTGGNKKWVERIDRVRLERVTPERITAWQRRFLTKAGSSPVALSSAKRTANSYVRCARSLFGPKILNSLKGLQTPERLPFHGIELFETGSVKYMSRISVPALIAAAKVELKPKKSEEYKVFLLGLFAGMRKGEIDLLEWRMMDWGSNVVRLEETEWLHLKTYDSAGEITVDSEVMAELRAMMKKGAGKFVISSQRAPRNNSARPYYRCELVFDGLNKWLRSKGVLAKKPLHELRKEIGALIATEHGIYAASRFLRHSDITTTARHYADHKSRISVGLGKLLQTSIQAVPGIAQK